MNVDLVFSWKKQEYNPKKENERFFLNTTYSQNPQKSSLTRLSNTLYHSK